jgi:hypothetical protein
MPIVAWVAIGIAFAGVYALVSKYGGIQQTVVVMGSVTQTFHVTVSTAKRPAQLLLKLPDMGAVVDSIMVDGSDVDVASAYAAGTGNDPVVSVNRPSGTVIVQLTMGQNLGTRVAENLGANVPPRTPTITIEYSS